MLNNEEINLTRCEQRYDYLFVKDFCKSIILLLNSENSGIYNLSSNNSVQLREILLVIKDILKSKSKLNFGALEYRKIKLCTWKVIQLSFIKDKFCYFTFC